jgi:hypothetical protein
MLAAAGRGLLITDRAPCGFMNVRGDKQVKSPRQQLR